MSIYHSNWAVSVILLLTLYSSRHYTRFYTWNATAFLLLNLSQFVEETSCLSKNVLHCCQIQTGYERNGYDKHYDNEKNANHNQKHNIKELSKDLSKQQTKKKLNKRRSLLCWVNYLKYFSLSLFVK